jgi:hypothetical protein
VPAYSRHFQDSSGREGTPGAADQLAATGPIIPVLVGISSYHFQYLQAQRIAVPPPIAGFALIDTGAAVCAIEEKVAEALSLPVFGYTTVVSPGGTSIRYKSPAALDSPGAGLPRIEFIDFIVTSLASASQRDTSVIALIGRSVLRKGTLFYDGMKGMITISL